MSVNCCFVVVVFYDTSYQKENPDKAFDPYDLPQDKYVSELKKFLHTFM